MTFTPICLIFQPQCFYNIPLFHSPPLSKICEAILYDVERTFTAWLDDIAGEENEDTSTVPKLIGKHFLLLMGCFLYPYL